MTERLILTSIITGGLLFAMLLVGSRDIGIEREITKQMAICFEAKKRGYPDVCGVRE